MNFIVQVGQKVVIITGETSKDILDFVLTYFVNLITFILEYYTTFIYYFKRIFHKNVKNHKKTIPRTSYKVVIVSIYTRNFDL